MLSSELAQPIPPAAENAAQVVAFRHLVETYGDGLRRYARRLLRSREAAEDLVQDVFWSLWQAWGRVDVGPHIGAYLHTATKTRAINLLTRERRAQRATERQWPAEAAEPPQLSDIDGDTDYFLERVSVAMQEALEAMPPRQRQVAKLRFGDRLSVGQIARQLGMPKNTVRSHLGRVTQTLRTELPRLLDE
jgi:RNA polymerase sigma factor (sigma-70 family)